MRRAARSSSAQFGVGPFGSWLRVLPALKGGCVATYTLICPLSSVGTRLHVPKASCKIATARSRVRRVSARRSRFNINGSFAGTLFDGTDDNDDWYDVCTLFFFLNIFWRVSPTNVLM